MSAKKITFLLPVSGAVNSGGLAIIHEYANVLASKGYLVTLVYPMILMKEDCHLYRRFPPGLWYWKPRLTGSYRCDGWFKLNKRVRTKWVPFLDERYIPDSDVVVATAWQTAEWADDYSMKKGQKFYFIQGLETMFGDEARVLATWKLKLEKIVISRWLHDFARSLDESALYVPNGLDFRAFGVDRPIQGRSDEVVMLSHTGEWKGTDFGLDALRKAKAEMPSITATLFGTTPRPEGLESWIQYVQKPSRAELRAIYNAASICLAPSLSEGWGLVPCEALMCGTMVIATDIGGHCEFAKHMSTAVLVPPKDANAMASELVRCLRDRASREQLALQGNAFVQQLTWERAGNAFEAALLTNANPTNKVKGLDTQEYGLSEESSQARPIY
jgi:glycosyltransferase involved in cell wall biosynthesis